MSRCSIQLLFCCTEFRLPLLLLPLSCPPAVAADAARSEHSSADASLRAISDELRDLENFVAMDFGGADRALAPLYKKCASLVIRQYTYEVCFFDRATQREGHSSTSLGTWKAAPAAAADQQQTADASATASPSASDAIEMHFTDGQTCWNGPARSLSVRLQCGAAPADGSVAQLLSVEEPGKCVYAAVVSTPVACSREQLERARQRLDAQMAEATRPKGHHLKDEL